MKKLITAVLALTIILLVVPNRAAATVRYIAQSAGVFSGGTACNGQTAITPATWNATAEVAGDISWVCGAITFGLNANGLKFAWSGSSGNPITLNFDTGGSLSSPAFASSIGGTQAGGLTYGSGLSWIVVDGKTIGIVQNTANGAVLANQQSSTGISGFNCSNCELKNITIANIYVSVQNNVGIGDASLMRGFDLSGTNWNIHDNTIHDVGWNITGYGNGDTNYNVHHNNIYNMSHGWAPSTTGANACTAPCAFYHDNHIHDTKNWDGYIPPAAFNCPSHGDGLHVFGVAGSSMTGFYVYNNLFDGDWGACPTGFIFIEYGGSPANITNYYMWNNRFIVTTSIVNSSAWVGIFGVVAGVSQGYNNTIIGTGSVDNTECYAIGTSSASTATLTWENNIVSGCGDPISLGTNGSSGTINNNFYGTVPCSGGNCWKWHGAWQGSFAAWKTACSCDGNSPQNSTPLLNADGSPQVGSPVIHNGTTNFLNLTATATGNLASLQNDAIGTVRPNTSTFNWDAGAIQFGGTPPPPTPSGSLTIAAYPLPAAPVQPTITSISPTKTYVNKNGCSQDGQKWLNPCKFLISCSGCDGTTLVTLDGTSVSQTYASGVMTVTVPLSLLPTPSQITQHTFSVSAPAMSIPLLAKAIESDIQLCDLVFHTDGGSYHCEPLRPNPTP